MAIEKVFVYNNTGVLRDEVRNSWPLSSAVSSPNITCLLSKLVAQRLGLIPIMADPEIFSWPSAGL